ncbi:hypothetical protein IG631_22929 [Alternaria alternata]|nr:hypothetical protein IG631_22929 [Alternaria alternata]
MPEKNAGARVPASLLTPFSSFSYAVTCGIKLWFDVLIRHSFHAERLADSSKHRAPMLCDLEAHKNALLTCIFSLFARAVELMCNTTPARPTMLINFNFDPYAQRETTSLENPESHRAIVSCSQQQYSHQPVLGKFIPTAATPNRVFMTLGRSSLRCHGPDLIQYLSRIDAGDDTSVLGKLYLSYVIRQIDTDDMFSQVPCVMTTLFKDGDCPLTTATALADCACTNTTMQSHLSACVQRSCDFAEQIGKSSYIRHLTFETLTAS